MSKRRPVAESHEHPSSPAERPGGPGRAQRAESFVLEVVLDEQGTIRRTSVLHVADSEQESWAGWEPQGVVDFVARRFALDALRREPAPARPPEGPLVDGIEAASPDTTDAPAMLVEGGAFEVRATLDPGSALRPGPIEYEAVVHAKALGDRQRQRLGELRGTLVAGERARLRIPAVAPGRGLYRLEMDVAVGEESFRQMATASGGLMQIT
jgi:hypothetical protein